MVRQIHMVFWPFFRILGDLMDSFELNKIAGAVFFTLLVYLGVQNLGAVMFDTDPANPEAYVVEGVEEEGAVAAAAVAEEVVPIAECWPPPPLRKAKKSPKNAFLSQL